MAGKSYYIIKTVLEIPRKTHMSGTCIDAFSETHHLLVVSPDAEADQAGPSSLCRTNGLVWKLTEIYRSFLSSCPAVPGSSIFNTL